MTKPLENWKGDPDPDFDLEIAEGYIGKYLLVGITRLSHEGDMLSQLQLHGEIVAATADGIDIELRGVHEGHIWRMPPFLDDLNPAKPGFYELRSTGESVENPDFTFSMTITKPPQQ